MYQSSRFFKLMDLLHKMLAKKISPILHEYNLTPSAFHLLVCLACFPEKNTAGKIVEATRLKRGVVSTTVENLCKRGLMIQKRGEKDKRQQYLYLTDESKEIAQELQANIDQMVLETFSILDETEKKYFNTIIDKIINFYLAELVKDEK